MPLKRVVYLLVAIWLLLDIAHLSTIQGQPFASSTQRRDSQLFERYVTLYWQGYDFADSSRVESKEFEHIFARYLLSLSYADSSMVERSYNSLLDAVAINPVALQRSISLTEKYLYETSSPQCNDELYLSILKVIIAHNSLHEVERIRPKYQLSKLSQNRVGDLAANIEVQRSNGDIVELHSIQARGVILLFSDPECSECARVDEVVTSMQQSLDNKGIEVVKIYPTPHIESLYHLRAIPTIYLLDEHKRVVLKDPSIEEIGISQLQYRLVE